jgi:tRNA-uridine 2-sulfurtransferase
MKKGKVALALSGGVDSAVAGELLIAQGYEVKAFYIEAYNEPGCRTDTDKKDALKVAMKLGIPFESLDLRKEYKELVLSRFYRDYERGLTPNPDLLCNNEIKFGVFLDEMLERGFEYVATGHYCRVATISDQYAVISMQEYWLQRGKDQAKDQSYFLAQVAPPKLAQVIFPLGELTKAEVRKQARELSLPVAEKKDSMGVCFVGELDLSRELSAKFGNKPGEVSYQNKVVGKHSGLWSATLGERVGANITIEAKSLQKMGVDTTKMPKWHIVSKDTKKNQLVVGVRSECYQEKFAVRRSQDAGLINWEKIVDSGQLFVRIRNLGELVQISELVERELGEWEVNTSEPVFAPAPGQTAVLYWRAGIPGDEVVVGWGEIA